MPPRAALRRLNSTANGAESALIFPAQEKFWQAITETEVFEAPMGTAVADVGEGTIVKEAARYVDVFNDVWIATADESGTTVWFRELEEQALDGDEEEREPEWQITVPESAAVEHVSAAAPQVKKSRQIPKYQRGNDEVNLIEYYWSSVYDETNHRDWNSEYQRAVENILFLSDGLKDDKDEEADMNSMRLNLQAVIEDFAAYVEKNVTSIVTQMFSSGKETTFAKHPASPGIYYRNGIMFRIAIDTGVGGGDDAAMKISSQLSRNFQWISPIAPRYFFSVPLTVLMTFGGYRVLATSIPPLMSKGIIVVEEGDFVSKLISGVASELHLKASIFNDSFGLSPSLRVVTGLDCRLYMIGLEDLAPPLAPPTSRPSFNPAVTSRYWRVRSEAVHQSPVPASAGAFIEGDSTEADNAIALQLSNWVRCVGLSTCAAVLGFMEPCTVEMERITCCGCEKEVDDELRFVVCTSGCCCICAQCNINAFECISVKKDSKACNKMLRSFVRCEGETLGIRSLRLVPDVKTVLHHHGVNAKFLNTVYNMLPRSAKAVIGYHLEIEMVARAAKTVLHRKLRKGATSVADIGNICAEFFMVLMQPSGAQAELFWAQELGPAIQELFDVFVPFDTETLDIVRLCQRVSELTGVLLTAESIDSFARIRNDNEEEEEDDDSSQDGGEIGATTAPPPSKSKHVPSPPRNTKASISKKPPAKASKNDSTNEDQRAFIQIQTINPTMKNISIPMFCETVGGRREFLADHLSSLLLLWAGKMDGKGEAFAKFEKTQPSYLLETK